MPIYEFECRSCGHVWDELQKSSDPDPDVCPNCVNPLVVRRMTAAAFRLKGAGWYETDFKKEGDTKRNLVEGSSGDSVKPESADNSPAATEKVSEKPAPVEKSTSEKATTPGAAPSPAPTSTPSGSTS